MIINVPYVHVRHIHILKPIFRLLMLLEQLHLSKKPPLIFMLANYHTPDHTILILKGPRIHHF
jgi:hypothetical protein